MSPSAERPTPCYSRLLVHPVLRVCKAYVLLCTWPISATAGLEGSHPVLQHALFAQTGRRRTNPVWPVAHVQKETVSGLAIRREMTIPIPHCSVAGGPAPQ